MKALKTLGVCRYFSLQATGSLRFDDSVRQEVESSICSEHGVTSDCFSTPRHIVYCYIERVSNRDCYCSMFDGNLVTSCLENLASSWNLTAVMGIMEN